MVGLASVNGQTDPGLQAAFSLTPLWLEFHFPPKAASPSVMGEDKQVDTETIVAPGATTNLGKRGERKGEERLARASS